MKSKQYNSWIYFSHFRVTEETKCNKATSFSSVQVFEKVVYPLQKFDANNTWQIFFLLLCITLNPLSANFPLTWKPVSCKVNPLTGLNLIGRLVGGVLIARLSFLITQKYMWFLYS